MNVSKAIFDDKEAHEVRSSALVERSTSLLFHAGLQAAQDERSLGTAFERGLLCTLRTLDGPDSTDFAGIIVLVGSKTALCQSLNAGLLRRGAGCWRCMPSPLPATWRDCQPPHSTSR